MARVHEIDLGVCRAGVTVHKPRGACVSRGAVLYFHGGGLVYGERDDLPAPYVDAFTQAGYTLYCFDYPLAPEATLERIHEAVFAAWYWFVNEELPAGEFTRYFLFGRSAGAYLALCLARAVVVEEDFMQPSGVLSFYGYFDLTRPFFADPCLEYTKLPAVSRATVEALTRGEPLTSGPKAQRFALYVYARQHGAWAELLGVRPGDAARFSLSAEDVAALPPLFLTASTTDADVPFGESKRLQRAATHATMKPVYDLPHDFDRDTTNPTGLTIYHEALAWMNDR